MNTSKVFSIILIISFLVVPFPAHSQSPTESVEPPQEFKNFNPENLEFNVKIGEQDISTPDPVESTKLQQLLNLFGGEGRNIMKATKDLFYQASNWLKNNVGLSIFELIIALIKAIIGIIKAVIQILLQIIQTI